MNYSEFVTEVRDRAQLETLGDAVSAIRATLRTLGEHLNEREIEQLSAQLPELSFYLHIAESRETCSLDEFLDRAVQRQGIDSPQATRQTRVVMQVLRKHLCSNGSANLCTRFSEDYAPLFEANGGGDQVSD